MPETGVLFDALSLLHKPGARPSQTVCGRQIPPGAITTTRLAAEVYNIPVCRDCLWTAPR